MFDLRTRIRTIIENLTDQEAQQFDKNLKAFLLGGTISIPAPKDNGGGGTIMGETHRTVEPTLSMYQYLLAVGYGKPAVAEPESKGADPFHDLKSDAERLPSEAALNEQLAGLLQENVDGESLIPPPPPDPDEEE